MEIATKLVYQAMQPLIGYGKHEGKEYWLVKNR